MTTKTIRPSLEERIAKQKEEVAALETKLRERQGLKSNKAAAAAKRVAGSLRSFAKLASQEEAGIATKLAAEYEKVAKKLAVSADPTKPFSFPDDDGDAAGR